MEADNVIKTFRFKVKPSAYHWLNQAAIEVNQVWNYCREVSDKALEPGTERPNGKWLSGYDLCALTSGYTNFTNCIGSETIQQICLEYAEKRKLSKSISLKWRISFGPRRALGWMPVKGQSLRRKNRYPLLCGKNFPIFESDRFAGLSDFKLSSFSQNALGEWFLNVCVEVPEVKQSKTGKTIGLDLGLKTAATGSNGEALSCKPFHALEIRLAGAQRRGHKRQAKRIHAKIKNQRLDALHKFSRKIVNENDVIAIGDVSSRAISKRMGKSVHDAGWFMLKTFLQYKGDYAGRKVIIVNERYTSRACSACGLLSGPRGWDGMRVREWTCECGATHDRDINAAKNILRLSQQPPFAGIATKLTAGEEGK